MQCCVRKENKLLLFGKKSNKLNDRGYIYEMVNRKFERDYQPMVEVDNNGKEEPKVENVIKNIKPVKCEMREVSINA